MNLMITVKEFKLMIATAQKRLEEKMEYVNSLNVFPVPDGDTGTNMNLTFSSGTDAVKQSSTESVGEMGKVFEKGLLMGARGNSGVILSQIFRGFARSFRDKDELSGKDLAAAFDAGVETAYKAVMKPVEGTILTVARESAEAASKKAETTDDPVEILQELVSAADRSLQNTPNLLPVLKEVGVVDSGGQGLYYIYQGFLAALTGDSADFQDDEQLVSTVDVTELAHATDVHGAVNAEDIQFGYCTEIMVRLGEGETVEEEFDYDQFRNYLNDLGDSLLVVNDDEIVKVHVHTEYPGQVMNYGQKFGSLIKIKVDNMREQHREIGVQQEAASPAKKEEKDYAIIAVASGQGVSDLFTSMGVAHIVEGGQTMNPSTQDFLDAMEKVNAKNIILLPNNSNIFMAAEQAAEVFEKNAAVIPSRNISQGLTSLLAFNELATIEDNKEAMTQELAHVKNGQITYAVRDSEIDGLKIKKDHYMGIIDGEIKLSDSSCQSAAEETVKAMLDGESEILTIIYGDQVSEERAQDLAKKLGVAYPEIEIEVHQGGQPVYDYIFSVE